jgi:uncharacterized membrane protein
LTSETISQNIETILQLESAALKRRTTTDRMSDGIAGFVGTLTFVLIHLIWFGIWAAINTGVLPVLPKLDPYPFQLLAMLVSLEGVLLSTFVLIKQNRMSELSDRRAHLDLQINLLTEREVTRLLQVTERLAERLGVEHEAVSGTELSHETEVETLAKTLDARLAGGS